MDSLSSQNNFVDVEFSNISQIHMPSTNVPTNIKLVRAKEFNLNSYGTITPHNVKQGCLGDCYLIASLISLSKYTHCISDILLMNATNGQYKVEFYINGVKTSVVIDDLIPISEKGLQIVSSTKDNGFWPTLIEKAYAKISCGYENIIVGTEAEALSTLTGFPCSHLEHEFFTNNELLFKNIQSSLAQGNIICGSCGKSANTNNEYEKLGLIQDHAYAMIDAYEADGRMLIKIMSTRGCNSWLGRFSPNSNDWTEKLLKACGITKDELNSNIYTFMDIIDYKKYFRSTIICRKSSKNFALNTLLINKKSKFALIKFSINSSINGYFSIWQPNKRFSKFTKVYQEIDKINCLIAKDENKCLTYITGGNTSHEQLLIELSLQKGEYVSIIEFEGKLPFQLTINFVTDSKDIFIEVPQELPNEDGINFLKQILISCALLNTMPEENVNDNLPKVKRYKSLTDSKCNFGYLYIVNQSEDLKITETIDFSERMNIDVLWPKLKQNHTYTIVLNPNEVQLFILKKTSTQTSLSFKRQTFQEKVIFEKVDEEIILKGKEIKLIKEFDIFLYSLPVPDGYKCQVYNKTDKIVNIKLSFKLENLKLDQGTLELNTKLEPKGKKSFNLKKLLPNKKFGFSYSAAIKFDPIPVKGNSMGSQLSTVKNLIIDYDNLNIDQPEEYHEAIPMEEKKQDPFSQKQFKDETNYLKIMKESKKVQKKIIKKNYKK